MFGIHIYPHHSSIVHVTMLCVHVCCVILIHLDVNRAAFDVIFIQHTGEFPRGVGHRVENGWGLTKVAVVLLNGLIW